MSIRRAGFRLERPSFPRRAPSLQHPLRCARPCNSRLQLNWFGNSLAYLPSPQHSSSEDAVLGHCTLDNVLGLGAAASGTRAVGVAGELDGLGGGKLQDLLEPAANGHEYLLALSRGATLAAADIAVPTVRNVLSYRTSPNSDPVESLADIDNNTHDLTVVLVLERLANGGKHDVEPERVDVDAALVLVLVRPLATVLVLGVFPLGADAVLEEMVIGLLRKLGNGDNVVLQRGTVSERVPLRWQ